MPIRPPYTSRPTDNTFISEAPTSYTSSDHASTSSTALTSPDLCSPKKAQGWLESMPEVSERAEEVQTPMDPMYASDTSGSAVSRGPSVKDRASIFEQQVQASSSRPRPLPLPVVTPRTRSTSPLRMSRKTSARTAMSAPFNVRHVPVPSIAPVERTGQARDDYDDHDEISPRTPRTPPDLKRGKGSAKRMIQQWESRPATPIEERRPPFIAPMSARTLSKEHLDQKPLPVPRATTIPAASSTYSSPLYNYSPGRSNQGSPARTAYVPSPLQHLQTPTHAHSRKRPSTLTPSPSSYSLSPSPSGEKRKKGGPSPLKEILNVFGGGIHAIGRKARGKVKEKTGGRGRESFPRTSRDESWNGGMDRIGTNGLPGGIVFSDRMGDREMDGRAPDDPNVCPWPMRP